MTNLKIGEHIRLRRKAQGLTQEQLANLLGVTKAAVNGRMRRVIRIVPCFHKLHNCFRLAWMHF